LGALRIFGAEKKLDHSRKAAGKGVLEPRAEKSGRLPHSLMPPMISRPVESTGGYAQSFSATRPSSQSGNAVYIAKMFRDDKAAVGGSSHVRSRRVSKQRIWAISITGRSPRWRPGMGWRPPRKILEDLGRELWTRIREISARACAQRAKG